MCSSVTVKALQSGCEVFNQIAGFFSAATDVCPVIGEELMCRALAMAESRVSSLESGPTPTDKKKESYGCFAEHFMWRFLTETHSAVPWAGP